MLSRVWSAMRGVLSGLGTGAWEQSRRLFVVRRFRLMTLMLLAVAWLGMDIYANLIVQRIPVAVVDLDGSHVSRTLRTYLQSARDLRVVDEPVGSLQQAEGMLVDGRVSAIVLMPSDLSANLKRGRKGEVVVAVDGSNILTGRNAYKAVAKAVGTVGAGVQLSVAGKLGARGDEQLARVVPIAIEDNPSFNPATNYAVYLSPALVFFLLHVWILLMAASMFLPGQGPSGASQTLGAAASVWAIGTLLGMLFLYGLLPRQHLWPAASPAVMIAMIACWVAADVTMASAFMVFVPSKLLGLELTVLLGMLSLMLSGLTWPSDMFPAHLRTVADAVPFTPFARGLRTALQQPVGLADLHSRFASLATQSAMFCAMIAVGASLRALAARLRRRAA